MRVLTNQLRVSRRLSVFHAAYECVPDLQAYKTVAAIPIVQVVLEACSCMKDMTAKYQRGFVIRAFTWASVNRFFIVRSLSGRPDSKPKRYSNRGGRRVR